MSERVLDEPAQPRQPPHDNEQPVPEHAGQRPELRAIPVAGRRRAGDFPPPPRSVPANLAALSGEAPSALKTMLDTSPTSAGSPHLREDLLANPRRTIRQLYEEDHPEWRLDRNATFAVPPAVWDTVTRHSAEIGVPAKRLMTAMAVAYFVERGVTVEETPRH